VVRVVMGGSDSTLYSTLTSSLERSFLCLGPGPSLYIALLYIYHRSILILGRTLIRAGRDPMFLSGTTQKTGLLGIRDSPPVPGDLGLASLILVDQVVATTQCWLTWSPKAVLPTVLVNHLFLTSGGRM